MNNNDFVSYPTEEMGYAPGGIAIEPKSNLDLPPGCVPVEYLQSVPPKYMRVHFANDEVKQAQEILQKFKLPNERYMVPTKMQIDVKECDLILTEDIVKQLPKAEQERAVPLVMPIKIAYAPPIVYRFISKQYVDKFFDEGELQISNFDRCKRIELGDRRDQGEGLCTFTGISGDNTVQMVVGVANNPLMLCSSLAINAKHDDGDSCIMVQDLDFFIGAITDALIKTGIPVSRVLHGPCTYSERSIVKKFGDENKVITQLVKETSGPNKAFDFNHMFSVANDIGGIRNYFTKEPKFSDEYEYRIVWDCEKPQGIKPIKIYLGKDVIKKCCERC